MSTVLLSALARRWVFRILDVILAGTVIVGFAYAVGYADIATAFALWALVLVVALPRAITRGHLTDEDDQ
jgi:hypothetical protein